MIESPPPSPPSLLPCLLAWLLLLSRGLAHPTPRTNVTQCLFPRPCLCSITHPTLDLAPPSLLLSNKRSLASSPNPPSLRPWSQANGVEARAIPAPLSEAALLSTTIDGQPQPQSERCPYRAAWDMVGFPDNNDFRLTWSRLVLLLASPALSGSPTGGRSSLPYRYFSPARTAHRDSSRAQCQADPLMRSRIEDADICCTNSSAAFLFPPSAYASSISIPMHR
ncbi:hypothetical protein B0T10DRAFT_455619 [Thelonectria olida]|uniref:Uncharacterized protein n=1 Tax=Thelonectria olida TaxID=1576542 RepID=A0A9P8WF80_9HYPO|nr:hypothetical protein B0T10DRAFT_455619 [Thelonectria olida]